MEWKSDIKVCGVGLTDEASKDFADKLNCLHQNLPKKYLGLPLGASPRLKRTWLPVLAKCKQRLASWKRRFLSFAGRVTLIKSVLSNLPIYYLSLFKMSAGVAKEFVSIQSNFLWGGDGSRRKIHLVKWKVISKSKQQGGLGVKRIRLMNDCFLLKWWWRFGAEPNALWKQVIHNKYSQVGVGWCPEPVDNTRNSCIWAGILGVARTRLEPDLSSWNSLKKTLLQ